MLDVEVALQRLEAARTATGSGGQVDDHGVVLQGLLARLENRDQLDRLVAGLPAAGEVAHRAHLVLTGQARADGERADDELIELARQQIDLMLQRARDQIEPSKSNDAAAFERLSALPIVVLDHRQATGQRYCVDYGLGSVADGGALSPRDIDTIAECEMSWPIYNERRDPAWNQVAAAFQRLAEDNGYLDRWVLAPATQGALPTNAMYAIWQAGAELWVQADRIVVARGAAQSATSRTYSSEPAEAGERTATVDEWLSTAGPSGPRAIELARQASHEFAAGRKKHLYLFLSSLSLPSIPPVHDIDAWTHLTVLDNPGLDLTAVANFDALTDLSIGGCDFDQIPQVVRSLANLVGLVFGDNPLQVLPEWIGEMTGLERLGLGKTALTDLPSSAGGLSQLQTLMINDARLTSVPDAIAGLSALQTLRLDGNQITALPDWIGGLASIEVLNLERNEIRELPAPLGQLHQVRELKLARNQLAELPASIAELQNLEVLELNGNPLERLPRELLELPEECRVGVRGGAVPKEMTQARTIGALRKVWVEFDA